MATTTFIWLGSGRARRRGVGLKGMMLDQAAKAGLPVPPGAILLDELYRLFVTEDVVVSQNGRVVVADPEILSNTLYYSARLPRFDRPAAVRAAGSGIAPARLNVDMDDPVSVASALGEIWTACARAAADQTAPRADVIVMDMIPTVHAGTATTRQASTGDVTTLADAGLPGESVSLPRLRGWGAPPDDTLPHLRRLQMLLRGVRRTFGRGDWHIDWIDDGQICYLIQVAPDRPDSDSP